MEPNEPIMRMEVHVDEAKKALQEICQSLGRMHKQVHQLSDDLENENPRCMFEYMHLYTAVAHVLILMGELHVAMTGGSDRDRDEEEEDEAIGKELNIDGLDMDMFDEILARFLGSQSTND